MGLVFHAAKLVLCLVQLFLFVRDLLFVLRVFALEAVRILRPAGCIGVELGRFQLMLALQNVHTSMPASRMSGCRIPFTLKTRRAFLR